MTRPPCPPVRRGFTLVELLVACALVVIILTILAVAFGAATESLGRLKGIGSLAEQLRTTQDKLEADLSAEHFDGGDSPAGLKVSDLRYNQLSLNGRETLPPRGGYFRIQQGSAGLFEGADVDQFSSTRAISHVLEMTVKRSGKTPDDLFTVTANTPAVLAQSATDTATAPNQFNSYWARVKWELQPNPAQINGVQTWTLYRSVRSVTPQSVALTDATDDQLVSAMGGNTSTLFQLANPGTRPPLAPFVGGNHRGDDIVLVNVLSFEVKPTWEPSPGVRSPRQFLPNGMVIGTAVPDGPDGTAVRNNDFPYDDLPRTPATGDGENPNHVGVYDTWTSQLGGWNTRAGNEALPLRVRVTGVQVKIRVYDPKKQLTRQVSFEFPL